MRRAAAAEPQAADEQVVAKAAATEAVAAGKGGFRT
jgi:hypothetical protein